VLDYLKNDIDYLSLHTYIGNRDNNFEKFLPRVPISTGASPYVDALTQGRPRRADRTPPHLHRVRRMERLVSDLLRNRVRDWPQGSGGALQRRRRASHGSVSQLLHPPRRRGEGGQPGAISELIAPIVTSKNGLFLQTIYWPLVEYGKQRGNQSLDALVTSPTYDYDGRQVGYLDVSATWDEKSRRAFLNV